MFEFTFSFLLPSILDGTGNCSVLADEASCLASHNSSGCVWNKVSGACVGPEDTISLTNNVELPSCSGIVCFFAMK